MIRVLPPALEPHRPFISRAERYFGLSGVQYRLDPSVPDIASIPGQNLVLIGRAWHRAGSSEQQKRILHELAHLWGLRHDPRARRLGYFSKPGRDRWSRQVYVDLMGTADPHPRFDPARYGVESYG